MAGPPRGRRRRPPAHRAPAPVHPPAPRHRAPLPGPHPALTPPDGRRRSAGRDYWLYRSLFAVGRYAPRPVGAALAEVSGVVCAATLQGRRQLIARHLERVNGEAVGVADRERQIRQAFTSYARYWLESCRATGASAAELDARMSCEGFEHLDTALAGGRGVILALPHLGSWDFGGAWMASIGMPLMAVVEPVEPPELLEWFVARRKELGLDIVALGPGAAGPVSRRLREGGIVALISDRDLTGRGVEVEFFGERTRIPAGPATLAIRTGAALVPAAVYLEDHGRNRGVVLPPVPVERTGSLRADVARISQTLVHRLEDLIRRAPEQWHLFQPNWPSDPGYASS